MFLQVFVRNKMINYVSCLPLHSEMDGIELINSAYKLEFQNSLDLT
jgi:hypothetical protein